MEENYNPQTSSFLSPHLYQKKKEKRKRKTAISDGLF
jgi:hypothetical protein